MSHGFGGGGGAGGAFSLRSAPKAAEAESATAATVMRIFFITSPCRCLACPAVVGMLGRPPLCPPDKAPIDTTINVDALRYRKANPAASAAFLGFLGLFDPNLRTCCSQATNIAAKARAAHAKSSHAGTSPNAVAQTRGA